MNGHYYRMDLPAECKSHIVFRHPFRVWLEPSLQTHPLRLSLIKLSVTDYDFECLSAGRNLKGLVDVLEWERMCD